MTEAAGAVQSSLPALPVCRADGNGEGVPGQALIPLLGPWGKQCIALADWQKQRSSWGRVTGGVTLPQLGRPDWLSGKDWDVGRCLVLCMAKTGNIGMAGNSFPWGCTNSFQGRLRHHEGFLCFLCFALHPMPRDFANSQHKGTKSLFGVQAAFSFLTERAQQHPFLKLLPSKTNNSGKVKTSLYKLCAD